MNPSKMDLILRDIEDGLNKLEGVTCNKAEGNVSFPTHSVAHQSNERSRIT
ncbi:hypothetical protein Hanom_Chr00s004902g01726721 [Helianthus anomalus]